MAGNDVFQLETTHDWRGGLRNLTGLEFGKWFRSNTWWIQSLIWVAIINLILAGLLWGGEGVDPQGGLAIYTMFSGLFPAIAVVIIMQDAIVGEKESGTAAWVLSKPVSRTAFVVSKFFPNLIGVLVTMVLLPGLVAYLQLSLASGTPLPPINFLGGLAIIWLYLAYYLALTWTLGIFFHHRAPVIGIPLALAFGQQLLFGVVPFLALILPWNLIVPVGGEERTITLSIMLGEEPASWIPVAATFASIVIFFFLGIWRFQREEF